MDGKRLRLRELLFGGDPDKINLSPEQILKEFEAARPLIKEGALIGKMIVFGTAGDTTSSSLVEMFNNPSNSYAIGFDPYYKESPNDSQIGIWKKHPDGTMEILNLENNG